MAPRTQRQHITQRKEELIEEWAELERMEKAVEERRRKIVKRMAYELTRLEATLDMVRKIECRKHGYDEVPAAVVEATRQGKGLPRRPGVYFVWNATSVVYVGQAQSIRVRTRIGKHSQITDGDRLSWVECPMEELNVVEAFYIGVCRPVRNFGGCG